MGMVVVAMEVEMVAEEREVVTAAVGKNVLVVASLAERAAPVVDLTVLKVTVVKATEVRVGWR